MKFAVLFAAAVLASDKISPAQYAEQDPWASMLDGAQNAEFGLFENENYSPDSKWTKILNHKNATWHPVESTSEKEDRLKVFSKPPASVINETMADNIIDPWETSATKVCLNQEPKKDCVDYKPAIGILTQPVSEKRKKQFDFKYDDYILEINNNFAKWGGSRTIEIPYNISNSDLKNLLPQINGVLFTGGGLDLFNPDTKEPHPYYLTAKKIFTYSVYMKDVRKEEWPILGICQGIEVIGSILNDDKFFETLDKMVIYGQNRPVIWEVDNVQKNSTLFSSFPDYLVEAMAQQGLSLHAHTYSIPVKTFKESKSMRSMMNILNTDYVVKDGKKEYFVNAMEAKNYPIWATMYHPEYQMLDFIGPQKWLLPDRKLTSEIAFRFSLLLNRVARKNKNKISPQNEATFMSQLVVDRVPSQPFLLIGNVHILAYGFMNHFKIPIFNPDHLQ